MAKKQGQKTGTKGSRTATGTGQMRKSDLKHRSEIVRAELLETNKRIETDFLSMAQLLSEAYHREYIVEWGIEDWKSYVEDELDLNLKRAEFLVSVWDAVKKFNLPIGQVQKLGWTKMKDLVRVLNSKNAKDWMETARKMTTRELTEEVRASKKREEGKVTGPETIKLNLIMGQDEGNIILDAIEEAKKLCETNNEVIALGMVCQDWQEMKGATPKRANLEAHFRFLERVYGVNVGIVKKEKKATKETKLKKGAKTAEKPVEEATTETTVESPQTHTGAPDGDIDVTELLEGVDSGEEKAEEAGEEEEKSTDLAKALGI